MQCMQVSLDDAFRPDRRLFSFETEIPIITGRRVCLTLFSTAFTLKTQDLKDWKVSRSDREIGAGMGFASRLSGSGYLRVVHFFFHLFSLPVLYGSLVASYS